jgi:hypothetical protein
MCFTRESTCVKSTYIDIAQLWITCADGHEYVSLRDRKALPFGS